MEEMMTMGGLCDRLAQAAHSYPRGVREVPGVKLMRKAVNVLRQVPNKMDVAEITDELISGRGYVTAALQEKIIRALYAPHDALSMHAETAQQPDSPLS